MAAVAVLVVHPAPGDHDAAVGELWALGPLGVHERDDGALVAAFGGPEDLAAAVGALGRRWPAVVEEVDDGLDGWRPYAAAVPVAPGVVVCPAWVPYDAGPGELVVTVEPGRSFGSGAHATTRLCAAEVVRLAGPRRRVVDVGCGSGVLAVLAARLGAEVVAVDVDPAAVAATAANAVANGVEIAVRLGSAAAARGPADVVVANLLAPVLVAEAEPLRALLGPRGRLVVSGLLADRWAHVAAALAPLEVEAVHELDGWVALTMRPAGDGGLSQS